MMEESLNEQPLGWWDNACRSAPPLRFIDTSLRGIGQVLFQDNPLSGLFFFVAIGWGSYVAGVPQVAIGGLLALIVANLTALWLRVDTPSLDAGLYGFNAYLVGIALPTFLALSPLLWIYIVLGGAASVVATMAMSRVMKTWSTPALTAPFILVTWLLLLSSNAFSAVATDALPLSGLIQPIAPEAANPLRPGEFLEGIVISVSQVFVKGNGGAAVLILIGLAIGSLAAAGYALAAALISVAVAHLLGAESQLITAGLVGFNPILTAVAVGTVFYRPDARSALFALLAVVLTVLFQGAMVAAMTPFAIPTLTAAFVLVTWLFLLANPGWRKS
jgi:urea transporter